ncbi:MAG: hypothetical protein HY089_10235 [Ignavibacteriales bacterium]|nr:hypothetical protein [Ignavibacteriales bacterium]
MIQPRFTLRGLLSLALCLMLTASVLQRASAQGMMRSPEERAKQLKEQLKLDDEQVKKLEEIFKSAQEKMQEAMGSAQGDRDAMRKTMMDMMAKTDKEIEALLTKDQKKKYHEFKKDREKRMKERMQSRGNN